MNNPWNWLLSFLLIAVICAGQVHATDRETHVVESGETLYQIAQQYDLSVDEILEWNDIDPNALSVGQQIYIEPELPAEEHTHVVEAGETLFSISRMYDVSVDDIQEWNELETTSLSIGQQLTVFTAEEIEADDPTVDPEDLAADPDSPAEIDLEVAEEGTSTRQYHTVRRNETLYQIAGRYNMTVDQLIELNEEIDSPADLEIGAQLQVHRFMAMPHVLGDPEHASPQGSYFEYRLSENDAIEEILGHTRMDQYEFEALNPGKDIDELQAGDTVLLLSQTTATRKNPYRVSPGQGGRQQLNIITYSDDDAGSTTTSGDLYNPDHLTAAHPYKSLGSVVFLENPINGKGVFVLINDRTTGNRIKVSHAVKEALDLPVPDQPGEILITEVSN